MKLVNLTPHEITIVNDEGEILLRIQPSGTVARIEMRHVKVAYFDTDGASIPVNHVQLGQTNGLPEMTPGVMLLVSRVVAEAVRDRDDILITDESIRDHDGRIIGCKALAHL